MSERKLTLEEEAAAAYAVREKVQELNQAIRSAAVAGIDVRVSVTKFWDGTVGHCERIEVRINKPL